MDHTAEVSDHPAESGIPEDCAGESREGAGTTIAWASQDLADQDLADQDLADQDLADQDLADQDLADQDLADQDLADQDLADLDLADLDLADLRRWAVCAAVVVLAYGGIAAGMMTWREDDGGAEPAAAMVIEMAPVPVTPDAPKDIEPGPLLRASQASPNKPVETLEDKERVEVKLKPNVEEKNNTKPPEEPLPEAAPAPNPDVAVAPSPPRAVKQEMAMRQSPSDASTPSAPQVIADRKAAVPAAPTQVQVNPDDAKAVVVWRKQIFAAIKKQLRYPARAERRGQEGTAEVILTIDRQGRLLDSRIVRGSGNAELDEEALAVLKRAEPSFTPPPAGRSDRLELNVVVKFVRPEDAVAKR